MERAATLLAVLVLVVASVARGEVPKVQVVSLADLKWEPSTVPGIPPGAMVSIVSGDQKHGPSVAYVKYPPGYAFPAHWHSVTEYDVVLVGKPRYTIDGKALEAAPGSYVVIPAKTQHQVSCGAESECVLLYRWTGALDFHFAK